MPWSPMMWLSTPHALSWSLLLSLSYYWSGQVSHQSLEGSQVSQITLDRCDGKGSKIKTSLTESHGHLIGLSWTAKNIMLSLWYGLTIPVSFWQSLCFSDVWQKAWPNYLQIKSCFLRRRHINDVGRGAAQTVVHVQDRKEAVVESV